MIDKDGKLDYNAVIKQHPWIVQEEQQAVLSPDSDGFLCGLLMQRYFGWKISGFYDGKILVIKRNVKPSKCVFLDVDINRNFIKSVGQHLLIYNKRLSSPNFQYSNCIQPNNIRGFDGKSDFQRKYPFATVHLLLGIVQHSGAKIDLPASAVWPLLFTDGVWNNLFGYTENCIDWIRFLHIEKLDHLLYQIFCSEKLSVYKVMTNIDDLLRLRDGFNAKGFFANGTYNVGGRNKRTGDKLRLTNSRGEIINLVKNADKSYDIHAEEVKRVIGFIKELSQYTGWSYASDAWQWKNLDLYEFEKDDFKGKRLNNGTYLNVMGHNPLSMAMTDGENIEYTLERPDKLV